MRCDAFFIVTGSLDSGVTAVKKASQSVINFVGIIVLLGMEPDFCASES